MESAESWGQASGAVAQRGGSQSLGRWESVPRSFPPAVYQACRLVVWRQLRRRAGWGFVVDGISQENDGQ